jgi:hypothetical protein
MLFGSTGADAQTAPEAFAKLQDALGKAMDALPDDPQIESMFEKAVAIQIASQRLTATDEPDYARSLDHDAELLEEAIAATGTEREAILTDVLADLNIKQNAGAGMGAGSSFPGRVTVRVTTRRGTSSIPGYVIKLNPIRWRESDPMFRLPVLSPASGNVPPGRYEVSAMLNGQTVTSDVFRIGLASENDMRIDLSVP